MALTTGTPLGNLDTQEEIYVEGSPYILYRMQVQTPCIILMPMDITGI